MPQIQPTYTPEDDINVQSTENIVSEEPLPPTMHEYARQFHDTVQLVKNLPTYTEDQVDRIQVATQSQSESEAWYKYRKGRITASVAHSVLAKTRKGDFSNSDTLINKILGQYEIPDVPALKYGRYNEPLAADCYFSMQKNKHSNLKVEKCGLFVMPQCMYMAASPDRRVTCDCCGVGFLEVKCPISLAGKKFSDDDIKTNYLIENNGLYVLRKSHQYYTQIQQQMGVTNTRTWCDFMVYTKEDAIIERVHFDLEHWCELYQACKMFFEQKLADALMN